MNNEPNNQNGTNKSPFKPDHLTDMVIENQQLMPPLGDGLWNKNPLLVAGLCVGPVVAGVTSFRLGLAMAFAFSLITGVTVIIASLLPRSMVYAVRIVLYAIIGSLTYIPTVLLVEACLPIEAEALGILIPLLIVNPLIVSRTEQRFFKEIKSHMFSDLAMYLLGFSIVTIVFGFLRELLATGAINGHILGIPITFPVLALPGGGFLLLGLLAGCTRRFMYSYKIKRNGVGSNYGR